MSTDLEQKIRAFLSAPWLDEDLVRFIREVAASAREESDQRHQANLATLGIELSKAREGWARACTERDAARGEAASARMLLRRVRAEDDLPADMGRAFELTDDINAFLQPASGTTPGAAEPPPGKRSRVTGK